MKKIILVALIAAGILSGCKSSNDENSKEAMQNATRQELEMAIADRDSLLSLVNDIAEGMEQIKGMENILSTKGNGPEGANERARIISDLEALQQTLEQRRRQLEELESRLSRSNLNNAELQRTIAQLRNTIENQTAEIEHLRISLDEAMMQIGHLNETVDSLNNAVDTLTVERDEAVGRGEQLENELNTCYYVAASSRELKDHKILETGFLRKTKLMESDFDLDFFTRADKRTLRRINLHSRKAKVLSKQPTDSYQIIEENGQKVLVITNPTTFWNVSNYLIVEID